MARAAGVSTTTVSDSLRGHGRLSEQTRLRVVGVAEQLGYVANPGAQNLRLGRTGVLALCFPQRTFAMQYYMDLALGAAEEALAHDFPLTLIPASRADSATMRHVDGAIVADPALDDPTLALLATAGVPVVTCERDLTPGAVHDGMVASDHRSAMRALLDHLGDQGARTVALLCPKDDTSFALDLRMAYRAWCRDTDAAELIREVPFASSPEDITRAVRDLFDHGVPDAIVTVPDGAAATALSVVQQSGRSVPEDVMIASYTDSPQLSGATVHLTAVDLNPREMGRQATRLLVDLLSGKEQPGTIWDLPVTLQIRDSTTHHVAR